MDFRSRLREEIEYSGLLDKEINERDPNSEKVYNDKSMKPIRKPIQTDSACRITADTKIRLKK